MKRMNSRMVFYAFLILFLAGTGIITAGNGIKPQYKLTETAFYLTEAQEAFLRPGLKLVIQGVVFDPPNIIVTLRISDDADQGLDRSGIQTPGPVSIGYTLARIKPGDQQYTSYYPIPPTGICQPKDFTDGAYNTSGIYVGTGGGGVNCTYGPGGGTYQSMGDGVYQYTMALKLPDNFEVNSTTTLGVWASRELEAYGLGISNANALLDFVPSGAPVTQVRDIVRTAACNQCHDPLAAHGLPLIPGGAQPFDRREVRICILCHNAGQINPESGNTVDERVFIHKLHMGANLPSVTGKPLNVLGTSGSTPSTPVATGATQSPIAVGYDPAKLPGKPYTIPVSSEDEHFDASTIVFPQDVRNCTTCHQGGTQSDNWKTNPSRAACGSCHDDVNFDTGKNHPGGVQLDDTKCSGCHPADTGLEFDLSVAGSHTIPTNSKQLAGLKLTITGVTNTNPGNKPTVSFTTTDGKGNPVDATKLTSLSFLLAGPTDDYTFVTRSAAGIASTENALTAAKPSGSGFTYTFATALPADAKGTFTVGSQAYRVVTIPGPLLGQSFSVREISPNALFNFGVGGAQVTPRRKVVDVANCNVCHKQLALHGGARTDTAYCVLCHNPKVGDTQTPAQTVNFRTHIHRIHRGVDLESDWTINGTNNFNGLRFSGDPRNCAKCHVNNSNQLPLPDGLADADTPRLFFTPTKPIASACLGCHDGQDAAAHAYQQTAPFGESCPVCHQEGADFAVSKVHARDTAFPPADAK